MAVLSFSGKIHVKIKYRVLSFIKKIAKSLQVPCSPLFIIFNTYLPRKRVLPFTLRKERRFRASMTVEAALALPLFMFFSMAILAPMQWMDTQRKAQTEAERFCEEASLYAYMAENVLDIVDLDECVTYEQEYEEEIPFFSGLVEGIEMKVAAKRRCWAGLNGKLKVIGSENGADAVDGAEEMVYVAANMSRYHKYRDCHYISNEYREMPIQQAMEFRTSDGRRMRACEVCGKKVQSGDMVYVTENGEHYHSSKDCWSMIAYVRKVPLSEVAYLGECSVCAKRG